MARAMRHDGAETDPTRPDWLVASRNGHWYAAYRTAPAGWSFELIPDAVLDQPLAVGGCTRRDALAFRLALAPAHDAPELRWPLDPEAHAAAQVEQAFCTQYGPEPHGPMPPRSCASAYPEPPG